MTVVKPGADPSYFRRAALASVAGTLVTVTLVLVNYRASGANPLNLIQPGAAGPSAAVVRADFPDAPLPPGTGHDGQQFYAIARQPMHPSEVAPALDRPRYRLQRILYPFLAWVLHPSGGGAGLIYALFAVGVVALVAGGLATGMLAKALGTSPWLAAAFPLLPGSYVSLRISTSDHVALSLAVAGAALMLTGRYRVAALTVVGSVLARESTILVPIGIAIHLRTRRAWAVVAAGVLAGGTWAGILMATVNAPGPQVVEFAWPFAGLQRSFNYWREGRELWGLSTVVAVLVALLFLARYRLRHPLSAAVALHVTLLGVLSRDVVGLSLNGTRAANPLLLLALLGLSAPLQRPPRARSTGTSQLPIQDSPNDHAGQ